MKKKPTRQERKNDERKKMIKSMTLSGLAKGKKTLEKNILPTDRFLLFTFSLYLSIFLFLLLF